MQMLYDICAQGAYARQSVDFQKTVEESMKTKVKWGVIGVAGIATEKVIPQPCNAESGLRYRVFDVSSG